MWPTCYEPSRTDTARIMPRVVLRYLSVGDRKWSTPGWGLEYLVPKMYPYLLLTRFVRGYVRRAIASLDRNDDGIRILESLQPRGKLGLYVHIPFCEQLCTYCSFNRILYEESVAITYFRYLREEIIRYSDAGFVFDSLYIGGGTPTVRPSELRNLMLLAKDLWNIRSISVETNPNHLVPGVIEILSDSGVNRLSVGVQTFDDEMLKRTGRYDTCGSGRETIARLGEIQGVFDTLNLDMMFNLPGQSHRKLVDDLHVVLKLGPDQTTYYPLMSDEAREERGPATEAGRHRRQSAYYRTIREELRPSYAAVSPWCFARIGVCNERPLIDEYIADYEEYGAVGSGSFGYIGGTLYANTFDVVGYIERLRAGNVPIMGVKRFSASQQIRYWFLMGLFGGSLELPAPKASCAGRVHAGRTLDSLFFEVLSLRLLGLIVRRGNVLRLTERGQYLWLLLVKEFFTGVNRLRAFCRTTDRGTGRHEEET